MQAHRLVQSLHSNWTDVQLCVLGLVRLLQTFRAKLARAQHIPASRIVTGHRILEAPYGIAVVELDRGSFLPGGGGSMAAAHQAEECYCPSGRNSWVIRKSGILRERSGLILECERRVHGGQVEGSRGRSSWMQRRAALSAPRRISDRDPTTHVVI